MSNKIKKEIAIAVIVISVLQLIFGLCVSIVSGVMAAKASGAPFWAGIPLLLLGGLGLAAGITKNKCVLIAWLVICIIMTIIMFVSSAITGIAAALYGWAIDIYKDRHDSCSSAGDNCVCVKGTDVRTINGMSCEDLKAVHTLLQVLTAFAVMSGFACFAGSIASCVGLCCYKEPDVNIVVQTGPGQQIMVSNPPPYNQQQQQQQQQPMESKP